jgi:hypothetical protein
LYPSQKKNNLDNARDTDPVPLNRGAQHALDQLGAAG